MISRKWKYIINIGVILLLPLCWYIFQLKDNYFERKESIYKLDLVYVKAELNGIVTKSSMSEVYAGKQLVDLSTNEKFYISIPSINWAYSRKYNILVVEKLDYIYKPANTDSIFIVKPNGKKFFFIAGREIINNMNFYIPSVVLRNFQSKKNSLD